MYAADRPQTRDEIIDPVKLSLRRQSSFFGSQQPVPSPALHSDESTEEKNIYTRPNSVMRMATCGNVPGQVAEKIVAKRAVFKELLVSCENDMVVGSWWYTGSSILAALIPIFPLINLYITDESKQFWPISDVDVVPIASQAAVYVLVAVSNVFFTFGSLLLVRSFKEPPLPPLCGCDACATDEVLSSWLFAAAVLATVPVCAIYVYYFPTSSTYGAALACCAFATIVSLLFALAVYPTKDGEVPKSIVAQILKRCTPPSSPVYKHIENDWIIICWVFLIASILALAGSVAVLIYYASLKDRRGIFDYATGSFDILLIVIGSLYYVAGSYPAEDAQKQKEKDIEEQHGENDKDNEKERNESENKIEADDKKQNNQSDDDDKRQQRSEPHYSINRDDDCIVTNIYPARGNVTRDQQHDLDDRHGSVDIVLMA